jgi:hypothetical protein
MPREQRHLSLLSKNGRQLKDLFQMCNNIESILLCFALFIQKGICLSGIGKVVINITSEEIDSEVFSIFTKSMESTTTLMKEKYPK